MILFCRSTPNFLVEKVAVILGQAKGQSHTPTILLLGRVARVMMDYYISLHDVGLTQPSLDEKVDQLLLSIMEPEARAAVP